MSLSRCCRACCPVLAKGLAARHLVAFPQVGVNELNGKSQSSDFHPYPNPLLDS